jgi:ubiquinone/menaquinone biosynthesis C-methylase UbiE
VLDVAAGAGSQSLAAARRARHGRVVATDISANLLEFAARRAREAGVASVETAVMDGERPEVQDEAFDAVESELAQFETDAGFEGPCELLIAVGTK